MGQNGLMSRAISAAKWSAFAQVITKLISPLTQMILARVLSVEAFGIIATVNMVITFADMFKEAGFQKYIIQHEFVNDEEKEQFLNVGFWTNFTISLLIWLVIFLFNDKIAYYVGSPGYGKAICIASIQIIFSSFSSIQLGVFYRNLDLKKIFVCNIISAIIPLLVTVPLAILGLSYWALIIGNLSSSAVLAILLTFQLKWYPRLYFSIRQLKRMFSFSIWTMLDQISIWFSAWIDVLFISYSFSQYQLGLYRNSLNMVNSLMGIFTTVITSVVFSTMSRLQNDPVKFQKAFFNIHKLTSYIILPISVGIFLYRDLATDVLLGAKWSEASEIIGIWGITSGIRIISASFYSDIYRAKGKPKISMALQILDILVIIAVCFVGRKLGFWLLVFLRAISRCDLLFPNLIIGSKIIKGTIKKIIGNIMKPIICTIIMVVVWWLVEDLSICLLWDLISIMICAVIYLMVAIFIDRNFVLQSLKKIVLSKDN